MTPEAGSLPARIGKLMVCLLLQVAVLLALSPAIASVSSPSHWHHGYPGLDTIPQASQQHLEGSHHCDCPCPDDGTKHGHCLDDMGCCPAGTCSLGAWQADLRSLLPLPLEFGLVSFAAESRWWPPGRCAEPDLPPPRRIA